MWIDIESGGYKPGEVSVIMAGRHMGKSVFNDKTFRKLWSDIMNPEGIPIADLILEENRVHGAVYHTVEPVGGYWPFMENWCIETFGEPGDIWPSQDFVWPEVPRWMQNNRKFWFRNIKDRDWFVMRWRS